MASSEKKTSTTDQGWVGVDLDGCLAHYDKWPKDGSIGEPIMPMVEHVRKMLAAGTDVRIFTARVYYGGGVSKESGRRADPQFVGEQRVKIELWCMRWLGKVLPITCTKDFQMVQLIDDRAIQIVPNTGRRADGKPL